VPEFETHHEAHSADPFGQKIGVLASVLAVMLGVVTILSHRAHTSAILLKSETNDTWQYYQSSRLKFHNLELGEDLIHALGVHGDAGEKALERFAANKAKYDDQSKKLQAAAREKGELTEHLERQALRYDFGEGLLEIGLVLTSLYFISRKRLFPMLGLAAGLAGLILGVSGLYA
jgi:hypothetical protein